VPGIEVVGPLPGEIQIVTTFAAGVCATSGEPQRVRRLLAWLAGPQARAAKRRHGMDAAA